MKSTVIILSLVSAAFSLQVEAASLAWGNTPVSSTASAGGTGNNLEGSQTGLADNVDVNDSWEFSLSATNEVVIDISSVIVNPTWLTSVTLDGNEINQSGCLNGTTDLLACTNGVWLFEGDLSAGAHIIALVGLTHGDNSGYRINVKTDDDTVPTPAPVPGAFWLFGTAAGLLKATRFRKKA